MAGAERLSVVVPTYGKRSMLEQTLESLARQTYQAELTEVVVVDDCSPDDTSQFLCALEAPYTLTVVRHEVNRGRAAARNSGVERASGGVIVFVDDDMRCEPGLLAAHAAFHEEHPGEAAIGSALTAPELGRSTVYAYLDRMGVHKLGPGETAPARYFVTNNSSVARAALFEAGLFDESFESYGFEDTELGYRLEASGTTFRYCAEALAYHIHAQTLDQVLDKRREAVGPVLKLLEMHPGRLSDLSLEALMPATPGDPASLRVRKLLTGLATNRPLTTVLLASARRFYLGPLSLPVITLLIASVYRRELASRLAGRAS